MNKVKLKAKRAEKALRELIAQDSRISQSAVEKLAGLSNGTLNYDAEPYKDIKQRIAAAQRDFNNSSNTSYQKRNVGDLTKQTKLKKQYRQQRDEARNELKRLLGERAELIHHTINLQTYIAHLESSRESKVVVSMKSHTDSNS